MRICFVDFIGVNLFCWCWSDSSE